MSRSTATQRPAKRDGSRLAMSLLVWISVVVTFLSALGLGWFQVYFQLFGEVAHRSDYTRAVGMYGAGAGLLLLTPVVAYLLRLGAASACAAICGAALLVVRAVDAGHHAAALPVEPLYAPSWKAGAAVVLAFPPAWSLAALLLAGILTRVGSRAWDSRSTSAT